MLYAQIVSTSFRTSFYRIVRPVGLPGIAQNMSMPTVRSLSIGIAVFLCGAMVMAFEIVASRILAPYIGTSTYIWTSLIGIILASLSLGYWLGGRMADRRPGVSALATVILIAGSLVAVTGLIKEIVLSFVASAPVGIEIRSVLASVILFAPASICLGIVTPYAVKLQISSLADSGKTVGRLYALSTCGSIAGTFAAGFYLIPFVGSTRTLYIISGGLIAVSLVLFPMALSRTAIGSIVILVFSIISNEAGIAIMRSQSDLHDIDTEYSRVRVFRTIEPRSGVAVEALATDPYSIQSAMGLDSDELVLDYSRYYHLARHFNPGFRDVLVIGGAGYSVPKELLRRYNDINLDVVEIDPKMTAIARRFFRLTDDPRMTIIHEDGRTYLNNVPAAKYDVIMMDAFGSLLSVPTQLTTIECVREIHRALKPGGVIIFNLGSAISGRGSGFLQAESATYRKFFSQVLIFKVHSEFPDDQPQNLILAAGKSAAIGPLTSDDPEISALLDHLYRGVIAADKPVLTDDLSPVEYYNAIAQDLRNR